MTGKSVLLYALSFICYVFGLLWFFLIARRRRVRKPLLGLTISVILALLLAEWAAKVALQTKGFPVKIFVDAMQVLSLNAQFEALSETLAENASLFDKLRYWYNALLYTTAPVVGGAVIYDVLAGVSPELRLFAAGTRRLAVFSRLNERSVLLAEDIQKNREALDRPAIVFTGCPVSSANEAEAELIMRARELKAICLEQDLLHCRGFNRSRFCRFFLIDENEKGEPNDRSNLTALLGLLKDGSRFWKKRKGCDITVFSDSADAIDNIRQAKAGYDRKLRETEKTDEDVPVRVHVARDLSQTCCLHLKKHPLFEDIGENDTTLDVVIIGRSKLAKEMFNTVFWMGQMIGTQLRLTVVCPPNGTAEETPQFARELERTCPELLRSCAPGNDCLLIYPEKDDTRKAVSPIYASLCFVEADLSLCSVREFLNKDRTCQYGNKETFQLKNAQRFFVMSDCDEDTIALSDELRRALEYMADNGEWKGKKTVSAAVENEELSQTVCERWRAAEEKRPSGGEALLTVVPFGSLRERFSVGCALRDGADLAGRSAKENDLRMHSLPDISATRDDIYNDFSRMARAFHEQVKMHLMGFDKRKATDKINYARECSTARKPQETDEEYGKRTERITELRWLEHRRWCAFLRTQGFSQPPKLPEVLGRVNEAFREGGEEKQDSLENEFKADREKYWIYGNKNVPAKMHPCLVECVCGDNDPEKNPDMLDLVDWVRKAVKTGAPPKKKSDPDPSRQGMPIKEIRHENDPALPELKRYDAPGGKNSPRLSREELCRVFRNDEKTVPSYSKVMEAHPELWQCSDCEHCRYEGVRKYPPIQKCREGVYCDRFFSDLIVQFYNVNSKDREESL